MRLSIIDRNYGPGAKLLFALIRLFSGHPVPDAAKLVFYRPEFYGARMKEFTHEAMRGSSAWSVGDRELMAAYVSRVNECDFCVGAHSATAAATVLAPSSWINNVTLGAKKPNQEPASKPAKPFSMTVGTSGSERDRFALLIATGRSLPA